MDTVVLIKSVCCFPNNKPWITRNVKEIVNKKKRAFYSKRPGRAEACARSQGTQGQAESCKGGVQKGGGAEATQQQHKGGLGGHENSHRLKRKGYSFVEGNPVRANKLNLFFKRFDSLASAANDCTLFPPQEMVVDFRKTKIWLSP